MGLIAKLGDAQLQLLLLRSCAGVPKVMVALRTNDPATIEDAITTFDNHVLLCLESIIGYGINSNTRSRIALPVSKGGLGIPFAYNYALPAYIGSFCQTRFLQAQILNVQVESLTPFISAKLDSLNSKLSTVEDIQLNTLLEVKNKHQAFLYAFSSLDIANNLIANLHLDISNSSALNAFSSISPESGLFLFCLPIIGLNLMMSNLEFQLALRHYLGLRIFSSHSQCNICLETTNDPMGIHALRCHGQGNLSKRHDNLKRTLHAIAVECGISADMEVPGLIGNDQRPADVRFRMFSSGKDLAIDVSCVDSNIGSRPFMDVLNDKAQQKFDKYSVALEERGIGFSPFIMSLFGVFQKDALDLISVLSSRWADRNDVSVGVARSRIVQRLSFCLRRIIGAELAARDVD